MANTRTLSLTDFEDELANLKQSQAGFFSKNPSPEDKHKIGDHLTAMLLNGFRGANFESSEQTQLYVNASENLERLIWLDIVSSEDPARRVKSWAGVLHNELARNNFALFSIIQTAIRTNPGMDQYLKQLSKQEQDSVNKLPNQNSIRDLVKNNQSVLPSYPFILNALDRAGKGNLSNLKAIKNDIKNFTEQFSNLQTHANNGTLSGAERQLLNSMKSTMDILASKANEKDAIVANVDATTLMAVAKKELEQLATADFELMKKYSEIYSTSLDESIRLMQADYKKTHDQYQTTVQNYKVNTDPHAFKEDYNQLTQPSAPHVKAQYVAQNTAQTLLTLANQLRDYAFKHRNIELKTPENIRKKTASEMATALYEIADILQPKTLQQLTNKNDSSELIALSNKIKMLNEKIDILLKEQPKETGIKKLLDKIGLNGKPTLLAYLSQAKQELKNFDRYLPATNNNTLTQTTAAKATPQENKPVNSTPDNTAPIMQTASATPQPPKEAPIAREASQERMVSNSEKRMMQRYAQRQQAFAALKSTAPVEMKQAEPKADKLTNAIKQNHDEQQRIKPR